MDARVSDDYTGGAETIEALRPDSGLAALVAVASYFRIAAQPDKLARDLALNKAAGPQDLLRAAKQLGLKARLIEVDNHSRLATLPAPAIACMTDRTFAIFGGPAGEGRFRLVDPIEFRNNDLGAADLLEQTGGAVILLQRRLGGPGQDRANFGFRWFLPSIWRYRRAFAHVLIASLFVQLFALVTPLFFQVVVDKVLVHRSYSTLIVLVVGLPRSASSMWYCNICAPMRLSHTTNRIDVELGRRLFRHLLNLPLTYFETRAAGQTVARMRELETIRGFLTGQGLFCGLDFVFTIVFVAVLFAYSVTLAWIVVASIPFYIAIGFLIRPLLKERIDEKFDRGAFSQQLLVESVVGVQTLKAAAVEPVVAAQWEERLAAYVHASFAATLLAAKGQNAMQYVSKVTSAALLLFGAQAVIDGELTVGALVAFNMIAGQVSGPILRLSQLWQDFQQVQVSVARLADILNAPPEPRPTACRCVACPQGRNRVQGRNLPLRS